MGLSLTPSTGCRGPQGGCLTGPRPELGHLSAARPIDVSSVMRATRQVRGAIMWAELGVCHHTCAGSTSEQWIVGARVCRQEDTGT